MRDNEKSSAMGKIKYEKPVLRVIELAADEVLGIGCKTASGPSANVGGPTCMTLPCSTEPGS